MDGSSGADMYSVDQQPQHILTQVRMHLEGHVQCGPGWLQGATGGTVSEMPCANASHVPTAINPFLRSRLQHADNLALLNLQYVLEHGCCALVWR